MKKLFVVFLALLLCACAKRPPTGPLPAESDLAARWRSMESSGQAGADAPYRMQLSMRFGKEGDTRRVTGILWGNSDGALRLDVMAGVGVVVAKIMEDGSHFLAYAPQENKAYFHEGATKPLLKVGVPVPFNLAQLAEMLTGRYAAVFGENYKSAEALGNGNASYVLEGREGTVELDARALPVAWRKMGGGWQMEIGYGDESLPRRLTLINANGQKAILLVKEREKPAQAFTAEQMKLVAPESAPLLPLASFRKRF